MTSLADRDLLQDQRPQTSDPLASILQSALDVARRGASGNVVQCEYFSKSEAGVERCVKARVDCLQVRERKLLQIASAFHGQLDGLADRFVSEARGHSAFDEILTVDG